ncbi:hypothetical protein GCM10011316_10070 [Roseibium aquae]|uniref:VWFA domain-containing protein n=1 Tax=Roseibium aquae TaxID=1323746 RepID=A0A916TCR4_9HYPH|nr:TadE/TadG family type IV pilus assembly protein [Roseibium aquae]GGB40011.1 hypothetical protein GCM10011316_10070 [Roseibium aquae]
MIDFTQRGIRAFARRFCRDSSGSILPIFGVLVVLLVVIAGTAVDFTQVISNREKMAHALDAAALSVATQLSSSVMTDSEIEAAIEAAFTANVENMGLSAEAIEKLDYSINAELGTVDVWSSIAVPTPFMKLGGLGSEKMSVDVGAQVNYSKFDVELALIVDVTGSMGGDMNTLRTASEGIVDILIPAEVGASDSKVRISLVPYSEGVNLQPYATTVTDGASSRCVTERMGPQKFTDARYDWDPERGEDTFFGGGSTGCSSSSRLIPLTSDRDVLIPAIRALQASGGTAGQTGAAWGWYTLSPNWVNLWPSDSDPEPYNNADVLKFAVMMTDGDNNRAYDYGCGWVRVGWTWQWLCDQWVITDGNSGYNNQSSQRHRQICENMKNEGIRVFGVYFGSNNSSTGARNMQACSSPNSYYRATSSQDLIDAFGNIARTIQAIYLAR